MNVLSHSLTLKPRNDNFGYFGNQIKNNCSSRSLGSHTHNSMN